MESPIEEGWEIVDYYPTLEGDNQEQVAEKSRLRWVVDKGFNVGKKLVITGVVISSVPFVLPPLVVISALGFAFSVPYGVVFASYVGTQKLMSKLLPSPEEVDKGLRIGYADYDSGDKIQKEREGLVGDTSEYDKGEKEIRTEYDDGGGNRDEVREEQEGLSEDTFENDNLENVELGGADEEEKEVRIEYDDDDGGGGDRDEIREEKEGLARDTLENDYPNNGGFDEVENDVQIEYDDDGNRGEIQETQEGSARDTLENDNPNQVELVSGVDEEEESGQHSIEKGKDENPSFNVEKTGDEHAREQVQNDELIGNERKEEERVEFSTETNRNGRGVFVENEGEQNAMDREKKEEKVEEIITETSKIEDEKKQEVDSKESGKRRKKKKNGGKRKEPVKEPLQETKISSENKEKLESDEKFAMEERSRNESISRPGEADSTNGGVVEEKIEVQTDKDTGVNNNESRVIVDDGDHSLEVAEHDKETLVDIKEKEKDAALHSEEESIRDAKVWEKIDAIRVIVGFKAPRRDSYYKELKALYLFTGIEAPSPFFDPGDFEEFDIKLSFLMSVIGVK